MSAPGGDSGTIEYGQKPVCCPLCGENDFEVVYPARIAERISFDYLDETDAHFRIVRCLRCNMVYSNPVFDENTLLELYRRSDTGNVENLDAGPSFAINMRRYLERLIRVSGIKSGRLLDIGCGCGHFLHQAEQIGLKVHGVEPSQSAVSYAAKNFGLDSVVCGAYEKDVFPAGYFDLISCIHVIDHVDSPHTLLETARVHLKPGGCMIVATHNIESLMARLMGESFIAWSIQHISYFSPRTLSTMLERCGLEPLKVKRSVTTYPLAHYVENGIRQPGLRGTMLGTLKALGLGGLHLSFPFGNFEVYATRN